jgi:hypothetical protein
VQCPEEGLAAVEGVSVGDVLIGFGEQHVSQISEVRGAASLRWTAFKKLAASTPFPHLYTFERSVTRRSSASSSSSSSSSQQQASKLSKAKPSAPTAAGGPVDGSALAVADPEPASAAADAAGAGAGAGAAAPSPRDSGSASAAPVLASAAGAAATALFCVW